MLSALRKHSRSAIIYVLFGIIILAFLLTFNTMGPGGRGDGNVTMATVGGFEIDTGVLRMGSFLTIDPPEPGRFSPQDLQRRQAYERTRFLRADSDLMIQPFMPPPEELSPLKYRRVMDDLIETYLVSQYAERQGMAVPDDKLAERVYRNRYLRDYWYDNDNQFHQRRFFNFAQYTLGVGPSKFEDFIRREMLREQVVTVLANQVTLSSAELDYKWHLMNERVDLAFVEFDPDVMQRILEVSPEELQAVKEERSEEIEAYYEEHRSRYEKEARAHVQGILIQTPMRSTLEAAEGAEREKLETEWREAREKVEETLALLKRAAAEEAGDEPADDDPPVVPTVSRERFGDLARERSQHLMTADDGGDFGRPQEQSAFDSWPFGPGVAEAVFALEPGEVSDILEAPNGFWIIRLEEKTPEERRELAEVRREIAGILALEDQVVEQTKRIADAFLAVAREAGEEERDLEQIVAAWNEDPPGDFSVRDGETMLEVQWTGPFALVSEVPGAPWGTVPLIGHAEEIARAAFALPEVGALGDKVFELGRGGSTRYFVIQLDERISVDEADPAERDQLRERLLLEKQVRHYRAWYGALYDEAVASGRVRETADFSSLVDSERRQHEERLDRLQDMY